MGSRVVGCCARGVGHYHTWHGPASPRREIRRPALSEVRESPRRKDRSGRTRPRCRAIQRRDPRRSTTPSGRRRARRRPRRSLPVTPADDALLAPGRARRQLAVGGEAGELRAGAGAAGRAVVRAAGAEDEVASVVGGIGGGPISSTWSISAPSRPVTPWAASASRTRLATAVSSPTLASVEGEAVVVAKKEPVAAQADVAVHRPVPRHVDRDALRLPPGRHVGDTHRAVRRAASR